MTEFEDDYAQRLKRALDEAEVRGWFGQPISRWRRSVSPDADRFKGLRRFEVETRGRANEVLYALVHAKSQEKAAEGVGQQFPGLGFTVVPYRAANWDWSSDDSDTDPEVTPRAPKLTVVGLEIGPIGPRYEPQNVEFGRVSMITPEQIALLDSLDLDDLSSIHHRGGRPLDASEVEVFLSLTFAQLGEYYPQREGNRTDRTETTQ